MSDQLFTVPGVDPDDLIAEARAEHRPIATVCLFSGGGDSAVLAHRCRDHYDSLAFVDTGTAVPGVREHVDAFAAWLDKPLMVYESGDAFRRMVLHPTFGFPGPAQHGRAYTRLKERQIEAMLRDLKSKYLNELRVATRFGEVLNGRNAEAIDRADRARVRSARVMFLTGVRRAESQRRAKREPVTRRGGAVFVNPLIDWTNDEMRAYRAEHDFPQSDVAALLHRSGECNCGSFAAPGEREMLQSLWPEWFERTIASLEREAEAAGVRACRWGERPPGAVPDEGGLMCSGCMSLFETA